MYGFGLRKFAVIPFLREPYFFFFMSISGTSVFKVSYPSQEKNIPPDNDIKARTRLYCDSRDKISEVKRIIGRSVISGATATLIPSFLLCLRVSVITSVSKGPGDIPALNPKKAPMIRYGIEESKGM
jgi:hypothetical protein